MFRLTQSEWETFKRRHEPEVFTKAMMEGWIEDIKEDLIKAETGEQLDEPTTTLVNNFKEELQSFQKVTVIRNPENNSLQKGLLYDEYYIRPQQVEWLENDVTKSETVDIEKSRYGKYKNTELNRKLGRVGVEFGKSVENDIEKGKVANIGDIHIWNGKKFKKQPNGKWLEVSEQHNMTKEEHSIKVNELASKKGEEIGYAHHQKQASKLSEKEYSDEEVGLGEKKYNKGDKFEHNGVTIHVGKDTSGGQDTLTYKAPEVSDKSFWDLDKLKKVIEENKVTDEQRKTIQDRMRSKFNKDRF